MCKCKAKSTGGVDLPIAFHPSMSHLKADLIDKTPDLKIVQIKVRTLLRDFFDFVEHEEEPIFELGQKSKLGRKYGNKVKS